MISEIEIKAEIERLLGEESSYLNCEKLTYLYTVLDHLYQPVRVDISRDNDKPIIDVGQIESPFIELVREKDEHMVWALINELVDTIAWTNGKLYDSFMARLKQL